MNSLRILLSALLFVGCLQAEILAFQPVNRPGTRQSPALFMSESTSGEALAVTVVGGTGLVGSRVCKALAESGASVTSVSKTGSVPSWCQGDDWTKQVVWNSADLVADSNNDGTVDNAMGSPEVVVSCLGVIGTDKGALLKGNGDANVAVFASAKRGGKLQRAVFVSVASEVMACQEKWLPEFFEGYFDGKRAAEDACLGAVDGDTAKATIVKPTFIYGGPDFGLLPPRVNTEYGSFIEELLSFGVFVFFADLLPGLIKVALRPPSSVDAVAAACAGGALGTSSAGMLDGTKAINEATNQPAATGFSDAVEFAQGKAGEFYDWAQETIKEQAAKQK